MNLKIKLPRINTYTKDGRIPIEVLYDKFSKLDSHWSGEVIFYQRADYGKNKNVLFPILGFRTKKHGNALWIISGIHGEEPAGVNAIAKNIRFLNKLSKKIPVVIIPLCNPNGYWRNWRYPNRKFISKSGHEIVSVGDASHLLPNLRNPKKPRAEVSSSKVAAALSSYVLKQSKKYKPFLVLDLHEDNNARKSYVYSQGRLGANDPVAKEIIKILKKKNVAVYEHSKTSFRQEIINGIVPEVNDSSIDELLSSREIIKNNRVVRGPYAKSVIILETNTVGVKLKKRVKIHKMVLRNIKAFFKMAENIYESPSSKKESDII